MMTAPTGGQGPRQIRLSVAAAGFSLALIAFFIYASFSLAARVNRGLNIEVQAVTKISFDTDGFEQLHLTTK